MAPFASGYSTSHLTHTKSDIGPNIKCNDCHNVRTISREMLMQSTGAGMDVNFGPGQVGTNGICNMCHAQQVGGPKP